jgi:hypothetical protein
MGNLSAESKAQFKEATRLRDQAYRQRRSHYNQALEGARGAIEQGPLGVAMRASSDALELAIVERTAVETAIRTRIDELRRELEREHSKHSAAIEQLREARKAAHSQWQQAVAQADSSVDAEFRDMAGCYSAASWKPYQDFMPAESKA